MSKKKNVNITVTVTYDEFSDKILLTSKDPLLEKNEFYIRLNNATDTEISLRKMLKKQGVIEDRMVQHQKLPNFVEHPNVFDENSPYAINLGVGTQTIAQYDTEKNGHVYISGLTGSGKTNILKSFAKHAENYDEIWDYKIFSPYINNEFSQYTKNPVSAPITNTEQLNKELDIIIEEMTERENSIPQGIKPTREYFADRKMIILDSLESILRKKDAKTYEKLEYIVLRSFFLGYNIIVSAHAYSHILSGTIKANVATRISLGRLDNTVSKLVLGSSDARETDSRTRGRGFIKIFADGQHFQAYGNR